MTVKDWWPWAEERPPSLSNIYHSSTDLSFTVPWTFWCMCSCFYTCPAITCNTSQQYTCTDVLCSEDVPRWSHSCRHVSGRLSNLCFIQTCPFLYLLQYTRFRYVQNPASALSHLKPHKPTIHPPLVRPFLLRLPDVERDSVAEWGGTRALVSPVKAKDLVHPSIPLGSPSNTHIPTKYCKGTSQSSGSYILMLLSGYKLLDFV